MAHTLILASTSSYRRELLHRLGLQFSTQAPAVQELRDVGESPQQLVCRLAREKASAVARAHPGAVVIGSDQIACLGEQVLGKPLSVAKAQQQLRACSGQLVEFLTAVTIIRGQDNLSVSELDRTRVSFRQLRHSEIDDYIAREQPLDCAGSFKCEGLGISLFEKIHTDDPSALIGLPLIKVCTMLKAFGISALAQN